MGLLWGLLKLKLNQKISHLCTLPREIASTSSIIRKYKQECLKKYPHKPFRIKIWKFLTQCKLQLRIWIQIRQVNFWVIKLRFAFRTPKCNKPSSLGTISATGVSLNLKSQLNSWITVFCFRPLLWVRRQTDNREAIRRANPGKDVLCSKLSISIEAGLSLLGTAQPVNWLGGHKCLLKEAPLTLNKIHLISRRLSAQHTIS